MLQQGSMGQSRQTLCDFRAFRSFINDFKFVHILCNKLSQMQRFQPSSSCSILHAHHQLLPLLKTGSVFLVPTMYCSVLHSCMQSLLAFCAETKITVCVSQFCGFYQQQGPPQFLTMTKKIIMRLIANWLT